MFFFSPPISSFQVAQDWDQLVTSTVLGSADDLLEIPASSMGIYAVSISATSSRSLSSLLFQYMNAATPVNAAAANTNRRTPHQGISPALSP